MEHTFPDHQEHTFPVRPLARLPARSVDCVLMAGGLLPVAARPALDW